MNVLDSSYSCRAAAWLVGVVALACRDSMVGRFFAALARGAARVCSVSVTFGLQQERPRPISRVGHPLSVSLISLPYLALRRAVAPAAEAGRAAVRTSRFAAGNWLAVVAAGVAALGLGLLVNEFRGGAGLGSGLSGTADGTSPLAASGLRFVAPALLVVIGSLAVFAGPRLFPALSSCGVYRAGRRLGAALVEGLSPRAEAVAADAVASSAGLVAGTVADAAAAREASIGEGRAGRDLSRALWVPPAAVLAAVAGLMAGLSADMGSVVVVAAGAAVIVAALVLRRPEVFFLPAAAFPWVDWTARRALGGLGAAWDDAFLLLSIVLLIWAVLFLRRAKLWTVPIFLPLLLAFVAAVGSVVVNAVPGQVGVFALRVLFQPLLFYFLGFLFPKNRRWVQWTLAVFVLAGVAMALHGIYQYLTNAPMPKSWVDVREGDIVTRAYSIVENPNGLGAFLMMGALLTLSMALRSGLRPLQRWAMAFACVVQLAGVAVTFSRGAWLGLVAGVVALLVMSYRRYLVPLAAVGVVGWFAMPATFTNRLTFAFSSAYVAKSLVAGRLFVWRMAVLDVVAHPLFGVGLGTFGGTAAITFGYGRWWVDNFYLQLAAEGGLILLALFLWLLLRAAKGLVAGFVSTGDPFLRAFTAGTFAAFVGVAAANVTAGVWETLVVGAGFWFMTGLASSAVVQVEGAAADDEAVQPARATTGEPT